MIVRRLDESLSVDWGNGLSRRLLVESDGMGFTLADTVVNAGTSSRIQYREHLEAVYCFSGTGEIEDQEGVIHPIEPGTMYALNDHDAHCITAHAGQDLRLVSVFLPALRGPERHDVSSGAHSSY
ncbi:MULTISPECIES: ectoine synthase [Streptomyces]|uniref:ectoine synthase n=1 Tax=Streptomyces TaxID=1883 RepID=UPI000241B710|nr:MULTISPECIES: ectoine synthase [Streptomyces]EHM24044.1 L-ectoine synthase [Streptomyces sp. W007]MCX4486821.1 ectoine synthase [Streptomyces anulatus]MCX4502489.1 ectoine synthase [Streptomyces anulatus]MCX4523068.1 ectoine synthase [Streptomyces anulatus]MCX4606079.1 ectoine synthase [Streptomyces anulatus]